MGRLNRDVETGGGDPFTVSYDLLVGADGARSVIREYLAQDLGLQ